MKGNGSKTREKGKRTRTIAIGTLARVEGEGALRVTVKGGEVHDVELRIFEPPRYFEAFLVGRHYSEVPDIVARICGICPVAYQMSAVHALEQVFGLRIPRSIRDLRRLIYCAEWIESHTLHVYMLHAPDFLGYDGAIDMAKDHRDAVTRGLRLKKAGNHLLTLLGGRSVHPVSVKVGGFSRVPTRSELNGLRDELLWARDSAFETVRWVTGFEKPAFAQDYTFVALNPSDEYPFNEGPVASSRGLSIRAENFEQHFIESQVPHSNALHCTLDRASYLAGPLARFNLNRERLTPLAKEVLRDIGLHATINNPFEMIVVRSAEILFAIEEALRVIDEYETPHEASVPVTARAGVGMACTEAPRGLLYHRYAVDEQGVIREAKIIPPTSQNQLRIEEDLRAFVPQVLNLSTKQAALACERVIRCYDPCISCATHFLQLEICEATA